MAFMSYRIFSDGRARMSQKQFDCVSCMHVCGRRVPPINTDANEYTTLPLSSFRVHMEINGEIVEDTI